VIVELGADMLRGVDPRITRRALDEIVPLTERRIAVGRRHATNLGAAGLRVIYRGRGEV
jgi:hypothetical protein